MTDIQSINAFWTTQTNYAWDDMIEDKRARGEEIPDELLRIYNQVPDKRDIKRFVITYLEGKCPINIEFLEPKPMDRTIKRIYDDMDKEAKEIFQCQYHNFKNAVPNYRVYVDLVDLYEYEIGMEHKQAIKTVEKDMDRQLKDSPLVLDYKKESLTAINGGVSNMLTPSSGGQPKVGTIYRYDPIARTASEIKNGRKLLNIEALPTLITRVSHNQTTASGSANKTYDISNLKIYCQHLMEFANIMVAKEPLIISAYISKISSGSLMLRIDNLTQEVREQRKELQTFRKDTIQAMNEAGPQIVKQIKDAFKVMRPDKARARSIAIVAYNPKNSKGITDKNKVVFVISVGLTDTRQKFLDEYKSKNKYLFKNITTGVSDVENILSTFESNLVKIRKHKRYLTNKITFSKILTSFEEISDIYNNKPFIDYSESDTDEDDIRLVNDDDFKSCNPMDDEDDDDKASLLETYLIMSKDKDKNRDGTHTTYFKVMYNNTYKEDGYDVSAYSITDDDIIDKISKKFGVEFEECEDDWVCTDLRASTRKAVRDYLR